MVHSYPGHIALDDIFVDLGECLNPGEILFMIYYTMDTKTTASTVGAIL